MCPEVNQRINYPVKRAMNEIIEANKTGIFDIENHTFKFCVSWMMLHIAKNAIDHFVNLCNSDREQGPRGCISTKRMSEIPEYLVPNILEAVPMLEAHGDQLPHSSNFGINSLIQRGDLYESRLTLFQGNAPPPSEIFSDVIHDNFKSLRIFTVVRQYYLIDNF